ncbi:hypothetical protein HDE_13084 [Halotydeus destructor]|nr:hypothetical protein HDE_13084 [Halotydeus destructor]
MDADQAPQSFKLDIAPRRLSLTQRLVGQSKEWMQNYYVSQEKDDQMYGHGFNDVVDDFVPGVLYNNAQRRRTMSVGSEGDESVTSPNRSRTNSISERVAGMQLHRPPRNHLESYAVTMATVVDDQS